MDIDKIRDRLDALNWQLLLIFMERLQLVREVAVQKKLKGDGVIHAPAREAAIFDKTVDYCRVLGLDPDYVLEIFSLMIAHAKNAECDVMGTDTFLDKSPKPPEELRANLLQLTAATAPHYSRQYCDGPGADAVRSYLTLEEEVLRETVDRLPHRELALDLGCATGRTAEFLQPYFRNIIGIDVCPQMIDHAKGRRSWAPNVAFQVADLQERIPVEDGSASFVAATFGAASEVSSDLLSEVRRVLVPGGKAFLSFYNSNAISNLWYYPWPSTMRAHLNTYNDTLEVWYEGKVYVVRGVGMKPQDLQAECEAKGLVLQGMGTFPTFVSILPRFFFSSSRFHSLVKAVTDADKELARSKPYRGTYLTAVVTK